MKYVIDEKICKDFNMDVPSVFAVLLVKFGVNIPQLFEELVEKQILVPNGNSTGSYLITQRWDDITSTVLLDSEQSNPENNDIHLEKLALSLMEIFPKGKKEGTNIYWRGNVKDTKLRLKKFFKLYGNKYTDKQILEAAKKYVKSFNGDYSYMRVLKYFIWKDSRRMNSEGNYIDEVSDLATLLENAGQEEINNDSWRDSVR